MRDYRVDFSKLNKFLNLENTYTVRDGVKEVYEILKNKIITDYRQDYYYNTKPDPVSYTHLDVYKRQMLYYE